MSDRHWIEPLGVVMGRAASSLIDAGDAVPIAGGSAAFTWARLIGPGEAVVAVRAIPPAWLPARDQVASPRAPWAGLIPGRVAVMGILNVTPDSFSDGGCYESADAAVAAGRAMASAGADIVDVGGESTRPGALPTPPDEERARVLPVVAALAAAGVRVSIDTRNAATMGAALDVGAAIVNDVSALSHDPLSRSLVARRRCPVVLMHMRGLPATMRDHARYDDVATEVAVELAQAMRAATEAGVAVDDIAIDPGFGFAKTAAHNVELLRRLPVLLNLGPPILAGLSRKATVGGLSGVDDPGGRLAGSLAAALAAVEGGASIVRVHDVAETVQALRVWSARHATLDADPRRA